MQTKLSVSRTARALALTIFAWAALPAHASFHLWMIDEIYSNASGTVQFIELSTNSGGQQFLLSHSISASQSGSTHSFNFTNNLPGDSANHHFLVATQGFADLGIVTPDFIVPNGFLFLPNG